MNEDVRNAKIRRAPSGKVYAIWYGRPLCDTDGGLRYFDTEEDAWEFLRQCGLAEVLAMAATQREAPGGRHKPAFSPLATVAAPAPTRPPEPRRRVR